jgi:hypothetical protein
MAQDDMQMNNVTLQHAARRQSTNTPQQLYATHIKAVQQDVSSLLAALPTLSSHAAELPLYMSHVDRGFSGTSILQLLQTQLSQAAELPVYTCHADIGCCKDQTMILTQFCVGN